MSYRTTLLILFSAFTISALSSCQNNSYSKEEIIDKMPLTRIGISKDITELSSADAEIVAKLYLGEQNQLQTKNPAKSIKNIVTVTDSTGRPAIYAINFNDGFIWVSATKDYYPILAEVKHGTFTSEDTGTGLDFIRDELTYSVVSPKPDSIITKMRMLWQKYEIAEEETIRTKVNSDYYDELTELKDIALDNGYKCYPLSKAKENGMSESVYNTFEEKAIDAYAGGSYDGSDEYDYDATAYIFEKEYSTNETIGPLVATKWGQQAPYNSAVPGDKKLGCVTIATAQFMKFYKLSADYNWEDMPNTSSSSTLSNFLAELRTKLKINDNGEGYISDALKYLNSLTKDPQFSKSKYSSSSLLNYVKRNNVAILYGYNTARNVGHAWICDGHSYQDRGTEYQLYVLNPSAKEFDYIKWHTETISYGFDIHLFSMNWGWYGAYDGWFKESDWPSSTMTYSSDKGMILKTK